MAFEIVLIVLLAFFAGFLRLAESAVMAARKARLKERADEGDLRSAVALELSEAPERVEVTVHILGTFVLVLLGAHLGSCIAVRAGEAMAGAPYFGAAGFLAGFLGAIILASVLVILVGEIIPKRLALAYPEPIARLVAPGLKEIGSLLSPAAALLDTLSRFVFRLFGIDCSQADMVTQEEVKEMIREGTDLGVFEQVEEQMVNKVLKLGDKTAAVLMTPRNDVVWLNVEKGVHELLNEAYESGHNNFIMARETLDTILGIASISDLSQFVLHTQGNGDVREIIREPLVIPSHLSALKVLEQMREAKKHMALVVDEYGGLDGVVTTHDLIEAVVGELGDEDEEEASIVKRSDDSFLVDAMLDVDEVLEKLGLAPLRVDEKRGYHSLGGFVLSQLGHIPQAGELVEHEGYVFEVVDMDKNRIDKILVKKKTVAAKV